MSELSNYLRANKGDHSVRAIGRLCGQRGHDVGESTVIPYFNGTHQKPKDKVLVALADVLNVPIKELRRLADIPTGETKPWAPPSEANLMSDRQRRAVDELIRSFIKTDAQSVDATVLQGRWGDSSVRPPSRDELGVAADADDE